MTDHIVLREKSIPGLLCKEIIKMFEDEEYKREGQTISGVNKHIKDTTDFNIPKRHEKWKDVEELLYRELSRNIVQYVKTLNRNYVDSTNNYDTEYQIFDGKQLKTSTFMVQKYDKLKGRYIYHNDFNVNNDNTHRVITFLWYLNTVADGGETVFWGDYKIQPKEGTLLLFPSTWTYPHTGKMPVSEDKYIITGWLSV